MELARYVSNDTALVNILQISCEHLEGCCPKTFWQKKVTNSIDAFNSKSTKIIIIGG